MCVCMYTYFSKVNFVGSLCDIVTNVLHWDIIVNKFKFQSHYNVNYKCNLGKVRILSSPSNGLNSNTSGVFFLKNDFGMK